MAECVHTMQQVFDKYLPSAPKSFNLQPYKADKYFGLLLSDNTADWFKNMLYEFAHEVSKLGTQVAKIPGVMYWICQEIAVRIVAYYWHCTYLGNFLCCITFSLSIQKNACFYDTSTFILRNLSLQI